MDSSIHLKVLLKEYPDGIIALHDTYLLSHHNVRLAGCEINYSDYEYGINASRSTAIKKNLISLPVA